MLQIILYCSVIVIPVLAFLWFIGRAGKLRDKYDVILENELRKKKADNGDIVSRYE